MMKSRPRFLFVDCLLLGAFVSSLRLAGSTFLITAVEAYNRPDCPSWPTHETWTSDLGSKLSSDAALHGPFDEDFYRESCEILGTDAYAISKGGNGICMHAHACQYEFCRRETKTPPYDGNQKDLPAYVVEVKTETDIQTALNFARSHTVQATVKTTGHSYHGASTAKDSLLIWMQNYPRDGTITDDYVTCDGTTVHAAIGINGGETWDDVIEAVGSNYHVVTGGGRTVSAAGGWLMGSGLSFTSRMYGIGVDQAIDFRIVLADGTLVTANACENQELFWALRGGGGGTFGVVTHVTYRLHPPVPVVATSWFIEGWESVGIWTQLAALSLWLRFWVETSPTIDRRFSGFWNAGGVHLAFVGTRQEADKAFLNGFEEWYYNTLLPGAGFVQGVFGALPPSAVTEEFTSWYEYKGGAGAHNNPFATDQTGDAYEGIEMIYARLVPQDVVETDPDGVYNLLYDLAVNLQMGATNYFLGGAMQDVPLNETSVHPALRKAVWNLISVGDDARSKVTQFLPNSITGACFNHHSPTEPDWRNALWGENYDRLLELKERYDPGRVFNCWHCAGYVGPENPEGDAPYEPLPCPVTNGTTSSSTTGDAPTNLGTHTPTTAPSLELGTLSAHPSLVPSDEPIFSPDPSSQPSQTPTLSPTIQPQSTAPNPRIPASSGGSNTVSSALQGLLVVVMSWALQ